MLSEYGRKPAAVVIEPVARGLLRIGISPNQMTILGTIVSIVLALWLIPAGHHFAAAALLGLTVATDMIDGTMARLRGGGTRFGATLDATCDRLTDGAVFCGLIVWIIFDHNGNLDTGPAGFGWDKHEYGGDTLSAPMVLISLCLAILVFSQVTSYVKARAEASGLKINGGLVERPERLIIGLVAIGLNGLGVPYVLAAGLWILAIGSAYTVVERLIMAARDESAGRSIAAPAGAKEFINGTDLAGRASRAKHSEGER